MVLYWRRMNASAPSLMLFDISCILGVPQSMASTWFFNHTANPSPNTLMTTTSASNGLHPYVQLPHPTGPDRMPCGECIDWYCAEVKDSGCIPWACLVASPGILAMASEKLFELHKIDSNLDDLRKKIAEARKRVENFQQSILRREQNRDKIAKQLKAQQVESKGI